VNPPPPVNTQGCTEQLCKVRVKWNDFDKLLLLSITLYITCKTVVKIPLIYVQAEIIRLLPVCCWPRPVLGVLIPQCSTPSVDCTILTLSEMGVRSDLHTTRNSYLRPKRRPVRTLRPKFHLRTMLSVYWSHPLASSCLANPFKSRCVDTQQCVLATHPQYLADLQRHTHKVYARTLHSIAVSPATRSLLWHTCFPRFCTTNMELLIAIR